MSIQIKEVRLTPKMAAELLETNKDRPNYRVFREARVKAIARDILAGHYEQTAETLKVDKSGVLIDGQHRCRAVIRANYPIECHIAYGVGPAAEHIIDSGMPRKFNDYLHSEGVPSYNSVARVVMIIAKTSHGKSYIERFQPTRRELETIWHSNSRIIAKAVRRTCSGFRGTCSCTDLSYIIFKAGKTYADTTIEEFVMGLQTGENLDKDDSRLSLRKLFLNNKLSHQKLSRPQMLACHIRAWNYYITGTPSNMTKIRWYQTGPRKTSFPTVFSADSLGMSKEEKNEI